MGPRAERQLAEATRRNHDVEATFVEAVPVHKEFKGKTVWDGLVHVFNVTGHAKATQAYAWAALLDEATGRQRVFTILAVPPVDSPLKAVQVSILQDAREAKKQQGGSST